MTITNSSPEWDGADAANLRTFLATPSGARVFAKIQEVVPALLGKGDTNEVLIRNGEVRGCAILLTQLFSMANPPVEPEETPSTEYPALDDDTAWNDGQKLNPKDS
jgi:hypothetical protein